MQIKDEEARTKMIQRLRRIEGQVHGVQTMLAEGRECQEILQQLSAVRSAVQSAMVVTMQNYIWECLLEQPEEIGDRDRREKLASDLMKILDRAP